MHWVCICIFDSVCLGKHTVNLNLSTLWKHVVSHNLWKTSLKNHSQDDLIFYFSETNKQNKKSERAEEWSSSTALLAFQWLPAVDLVSDSFQLDIHPPLTGVWLALTEGHWTLWRKTTYQQLICSIMKSEQDPLRSEDSGLNPFPRELGSSGQDSQPVFKSSRFAVNFMCPFQTGIWSFQKLPHIFLYSERSRNMISRKTSVILLC